jgi:lipoyl(octanoyl) transferase
MKWIKLQNPQEYSYITSLMENSLTEVINGAEEVIYSLEHLDVYTAGVGASESDLIDSFGIPVHHVGRGGKYTYHGPGQLVVYPIIDLRKREKDLHLYVRNLEKIIINSLAKIGIDSFTIEGKVGIWVLKNNNPAKIAAIGIRVKKWITYHGIAVNVSPDLSKFSGIIPCGIAEFGVTSIEEMGARVPMKEFEKILEGEFGMVYS